MGEVKLNGKVYHDHFDRESLQAMSVMGYHTFRYYPKDRLIINSDFAMEAYGCKKIYENMPDSFIADFVDEEYADEYRQMYACIDEGAKKATTTFSYKGCGGVCQVTLSPIEHDPEGKPEVVLGIVQDVTELIEKERQRREGNSIIGGLSSIYSAIYQIDFQTHSFRELFTEEPLRAALGQAGDASIGLTTSVERLILPESRAEMRVFNEISTMPERIGDKKIITQEYVGINSGWSRAGIIPTERDSKGAVTKALYVTRSIRHEKDRLDAQSNLINALAATYQNVYVVNMITHESEAYRMSSVIDLRYGRSFASGNYEDNMRTYIEHEVYEEDRKLFDRVRTIGEMEQSFAENDNFSFTYRVFRDRETIIYFQCQAIRPSQERPEFVIAFRDVDSEVQEQIALQKVLREAYDAAEAASRAKTDFLANMSHDIRTPMNAIIGMTAIAGAHIDDKERVQDCLRKITTASKHLLSLINEVLDMSKIESGKIDMDEEKINLSDLIDNLLTMVRPQIVAHSHELIVNIKNVENENVIGDSLRLQQLFVNLMSNAVKYTPDGGQIKLSVTEKPTNQHRVGCYEIVVEDNGIGMSEEFVKTLFQPFARAKDERIGNVQGTGLGMAISESIVRMMDGSIQVDSKLNEGTRFTVTIFLKLQDAEQINCEEFVDLPILVADGDEVSRESAAGMLGSLGMKAEGVPSGREAVARVTERRRQGKDFFAVILDWKMPDMDGTAAIRAIRREIGGNIPIIVSAYDWTDIEQSARAAGANSFISKPLFKSRLVQLFRGLVSREEEKTEEDPFSDFSGMDLSGHRVLLVEDNELNAEIATEILSMTGIAVDHANDGAVAVDRIRDRGDICYDLILMDIQMPRMNGYDATRAIRNLGCDYCRTVPIIAMTANAFAEDVQAALSAGMNAHIAKPLDLKTLADVLNQWVVEPDGVVA